MKNWKIYEENERDPFFFFSLALCLLYDGAPIRGCTRTRTHLVDVLHRELQVVALQDIRDTQGTGSRGTRVAFSVRGQRVALAVEGAERGRRTPRATKEGSPAE